MKKYLVTIQWDQGGGLGNIENFIMEAKRKPTAKQALDAIGVTTIQSISEDTGTPYFGSSDEIMVVPLDLITVIR